MFQTFKLCLFFEHIFIKFIIIIMLNKIFNNSHLNATDVIIIIIIIIDKNIYFSVKKVIH